MFLPDYLTRLLTTFGRARIYFMYDPLRQKPSLYMKLRLWSDLSVVATITMGRDFRPNLQLQLTTKLFAGFTLTSPGQPIRLRYWHA
jgi:hypothetical protein